MKHYWPTENFSTPADNMCLHIPPSPDGDYRCVKGEGHAGKHEYRWSPVIKSWSFKDVCVTCGDTPIREILDGDRLCQNCCNQWVKAEAS
jgi:hypothetical protein